MWVLSCGMLILRLQLILPFSKRIVSWENLSPRGRLLVSETKDPRFDSRLFEKEILPKYECNCLKLVTYSIQNLSYNNNKDFKLVCVYQLCLPYTKDA